jgi:hypothetical protein
VTYIGHVKSLSRVNDHLVLGERSPEGQYACVAGGRTFVHGRLARKRTIAQCWENVRFISVCSTIESTSANDRPGMGERSLHQCV